MNFLFASLCGLALLLIVIVLEILVRRSVRVRRIAPKPAVVTEAERDAAKAADVAHEAAAKEALSKLSVPPCPACGGTKCWFLGYRTHHRHCTYLEENRIIETKEADCRCQDCGWAGVLPVYERSDLNPAVSAILDRWRQYLLDRPPPTPEEVEAAHRITASYEAWAATQPQFRIEGGVAVKFDNVPANPGK